VNDYQQMQRLIQFYHRQVTLMLLPGAPPGGEPVRLLLDPEPQRAGEDAVATALRLLERVIPAYPRAFDLVLAEALYGTAPFFNFPLARHKHVRVVLQDDRRNLYQDAAGLFDRVAPAAGRYPCEPPSSPANAESESNTPVSAHSCPFPFFGCGIAGYQKVREPAPTAWHAIMPPGVVHSGIRSFTL